MFVTTMITFITGLDYFVKNHKAIKGNLVSFDYKATSDGKDFKGSEGKNTQIILGKDLQLDVSPFSLNRFRNLAKR